MGRINASIVLAVLFAVGVPVMADENSAPGWLELARAESLNTAVISSNGDQPQPSKPAPLPFHTIEGVGGVAITPTAYLVNPGPEGTKIGLPSASFTYVNLGKKSIQTFAVTQTFLRRFEVGYAISRFDLGTLGDALKKANSAYNIRDDVYLHNFNLRALLIEENSWGLPFVPAITAGVHFKLNSGISSINSEIGHSLATLGYARSNGTDFTLTASKTLPDVLGRPVIVSVGMRNSQASQIGYLGFADHCATTVEGNVICLLTDWLAVAYEFRQKTNPYNRLNNLIGDEDNWHTIAVGIVIDEHLTLSGGWGHFGNVFNSTENCGWAISLKYEF